MDKQEMIEQAALAYDLIQKLFYECSYMIKEVERVLNEEDEEFLIIRPSGYQISSRGSSGLESNTVKLWLMRKFAVAFAEKQFNVNGRTPINDNLKIIYIRFILDSNEYPEPAVFAGVLHQITNNKDRPIFEKHMQHFEYYDKKLFQEYKNIEYDDYYVSLKGELFKRNLFDITDSKKINTKIIDPVLKLYRKL